MTQLDQQHCAFCDYREPGGVLSIKTPDGPRRYGTCWTCAREAADYYRARLGYRVIFRPIRRP